MNNFDKLIEDIYNDGLRVVKNYMQDRMYQHYDIRTRALNADTALARLHTNLGHLSEYNMELFIKLYEETRKDVEIIFSDVEQLYDHTIVYNNKRTLAQGVRITKEA